ncbi:hypothetical protein TRAPUB_5760 [Trametes pubescens]|uniref:Uncharacterized protein n=1 Tax=Trametes pubescens TaxID=154538 RepID=A0A1M2V7M4_TRAPU|nr:hypothetical protein TRAPUB_5760 [Trametes pubescens]
MASHSTGPSSSNRATSSRKGASHPHSNTSKPWSLLITHAAKNSLTQRTGYFSTESCPVTRKAASLGPVSTPGSKSVTQILGTRPHGVTAQGFLLYKQKRKWSKWISDNDARTQGHDNLVLTVPFEPIGTPVRAPSASLPRHPEFACPPKMKAVRAPFDHRKKVTRRTPADYLRMHHLAWKELMKEKIARFAQRTDKIIVDELDLPWSMEAMAMDVDGDDGEEEQKK